ncbi:ComF family protein [soil metagenome]
MLLQSRCAGCDRPGVPLCRTCRFALVHPARPPVVAAPATGRARSGAGADATDRIIAAVPFTGRARDVVLGFKYRNRRQLAAHLAGLLVNRLLADGVRPGVDIDVVTWAPTSAGRRRQRGFDQAELIARQVALQLGLRSRRLLERGHDAPTQTGLGRVDRLKGPTFGARPDVAGRRVLVLDDVVTTGATLRSAGATLRDAGAHGVVLAAVASTPGGVASRRQRWGQVVTGPWADSGTAPTRRTA